nr:hypothetical protein [Luteolibacter marinus]
MIVVGAEYSFTNEGYPQYFSIPISNESGDRTTDLSITGVTAAGDDASSVSDIYFPSSVAARDDDYIDFNFTPGTRAGIYSFSLLVDSNDASGATPRLINVTVEVKDPTIAVSGTSIDFGLPGVPETTETITIYNDGDGLDLVIDGTSTTLEGSPAFTIETALPLSIPAGDSADLAVKFTPGSAVGVFAGTLTIGSNDYEGNTPAILLQGVAMPEGNHVPLDFGRSNSPATVGYEEVLVAEGVSKYVSGVNVSLVSRDGDIVAGAAGGGVDTVNIDYAKTTFNGADDNYISVLISGLQTGTLELMSTHRYASSFDLPFDLHFGEAGGTLELVADDLIKGSSFNLTREVVAGKTYELRVLEQGTSNVAYISSLLLWGSAVGDGSGVPGYTAWALGNGLSGNPEADFDRDGISDIIEFITGSDPKDGTTTNPLGVETSEGYVTYTFQRDDASEVAGVEVKVQVSPDLADWTTTLDVGENTANSSLGVIITENGSDPDTITVTLPMTGDPVNFARLAGTSAP